MIPERCDVTGAESSIPTATSFAQLLMALFFVLGLIFFATYLFKKWSGFKTQSFKTNRVPIHVLGHTPLGERKFLSVVEVNGEFFFLGITAQSINLVSRLDLKADELETNQENSASFENIFIKVRSLLKK
jgi:flagellar protein FliO/FliZ